MLGSLVENNPETVRYVASREGMDVANHTWNHPNLTKQSASGVGSQLSRTTSVLQKYAGTTPTYMRPPGGSNNSTVNGIVGSQGMSVILWSVDTLDWRYRNTASILRQLRAQLRPGAIILMHDIHSTTVDAVPAVLAELRAKGYKVVPLDVLLGKTVPGKIYHSGFSC